MRARRSVILLAFAISVFVVAADKADQPKVELRVAKYDEMSKTITDLKGKIVIVDFWADT